jgi:thiamine-monophosphate kinase
MKISDIGEFGFIDAIKEETLFAPDNVVIGIGDDGAVYRTTAGMEQIAVIDTMVEDCHFIIGQTADWFDVGYKAVASNLSDIAAMGGIPTHIVLSTAISPNMEVDDLISLYKGIKEVCRQFRVNIIGGDTVTSRQGLVITVAAFGEIEEGKAICRSGARDGDVLAVSHCVGNSAGGLDVQLSHKTGYQQLVLAHRMPVPQVVLGRHLVRHHCHSINDISDGLASEANEIASASQVQLIIDRSLIPTSDELSKWCRQEQKSLWDLALYGGEDYELLFTMTPEDFNLLHDEYPDVTAIGIVRQGPAAVHLLHDGSDEILLPHGFQHFDKEDKSHD